MTADFPWLNDTFASALSNPSDLSPSPYSLYYVSLSIASTYLLACIVTAFLAIFLTIIGSIWTDAYQKC